MKRYVQFGCGLDAPDDWVNYDASPSLRLQRIPIIGRLLTGNVRFPRNVRYGDIVRGLPEKPHSVDFVYCSHVLEHMSPVDLRVALKNVNHIMRSSRAGVFRLVLPDLEFMIGEYSGCRQQGSGYLFVKNLLMRPEDRPRGFRAVISGIVGNSDHRWMWDYRDLHNELSLAGFVDIRRAQFGDNPDPMLRSVENEERWSNCLGIECLKP